MTAMRGPLVLIIDLGSSSTRATVWDAQGRAVHGAAAGRSVSFRSDGTGALEDCADAALERTASAIDDLLAILGERASSIAAVGMATYVGNALPVSSGNRPAGPVYTYGDSRDAGQSSWLRERIDEAATIDRTGCRFHASYLPVRFRWVQEHASEVWAAAARWSSLGAWLVSQFTGRDPGVSYSVASWSGLLDRRRLVWDQPLLDALAVSLHQLPRLVDIDEPVSGLAQPWRSRWPALAQVPWYPAVADGAAANVGSGCTGPGSVALTVGTTAAVRVVLTHDPEPVPEGLWAYRVDREMRLLGGALTEGGNVMAWLSTQLGVALDGHFRGAVAAAAPGRHGLTALPLLWGERSPGWAAGARGAITGLTLGTTAADLGRALLEGVAYRLAAVLELLAPHLQAEADVIGSGGGLEGWPVWRQIIADAIGRPLLLSGEPEATSRGVALLALRSLGAIDDLASLPARLGEATEPTPASAAAYARARAEQQRLYDLLVQPPSPGGAG